MITGTIGIHVRSSGGKIEKVGGEFEAEDFGGTLPDVGDHIIVPSIAVSPSAEHPDARVVLKVVGRMFGAGKNLQDVALIVEEREISSEEHSLLG